MWQHKHSSFVKQHSGERLLCSWHILLFRNGLASADDMVCYQQRFRAVRQLLRDSWKMMMIQLKANRTINRIRSPGLTASSVVDQCIWGKSANWICNFGKKIGSGHYCSSYCCKAMQGVKFWWPQNWCWPEESDCLIKTKHCENLYSYSRNVISAQCSECHCDEIHKSAGKRRE